MPRHRRGFTVLVVMALLSAAVLATYAVMRAQATAVQLSQNGERMTAARDAALTGLTMALAQMHRTVEWGGVGGTYIETLSANESFQASYTAGDPDLNSSHPDWELYPYRVTIDVTGTATDPLGSASVSTHDIRAVVQLQPTALATEPTGWDDILQYTVWQGWSEDVQIELPFRVEGDVRVQGAIDIANDQPDVEDARTRYLEDLEAMRHDGEADSRPFEGPLYISFAQQSAGTLDDLGVKLALPLVDTPAELPPTELMTQPAPSSYTTYQIYPGGPIYTVATLSGTFTGVTYDVDPLSNPLGIVKKTGAMVLSNDVTIRGTLLCDNKVDVNGTNVVFAAVDMPPLYGTTDPVRIPTVLADDFWVDDGATGSLTGLVAVWDEYCAKQGTHNTTFPVIGHLLVRQLTIEKRDEWDAVNWQTWYDLFIFLNIQTAPLKYFPKFMHLPPNSLEPVPKHTIAPDPSPVQYHWKNPAASETIYVPRTEDVGLHWDVVRIEFDP